MALRFFDGFDTYGVLNDVAARWVLSGSTPALVVAGGRFAGGNAMRLSGGNLAYFSRPGLGAQPTWVVGTAFRTSGVTNYVRDVMQVRDAGTMQVSFRLLTTGAVACTRNGTILAQTAVGLIVPNVWYYLELKTTIHATTGSYELRINGQNVLSATNQNTRNTANSSADEVLFADGSGSGPTNDWDDLYACDGTGATQNDFLGDCRLVTLSPVAPGVSNGMSLPAGQTGYSALRDAVLADSPVHFWEFQETAGLGASDTGASGTLSAAGFVGPRVVAEGPWGNRAVDIQLGSYAMAPGTPSMNLVADMTAEAWVYVPGSAANPRTIVGRGISGIMAYSLQVDTGNQQPRWVQGGTGFNTTGVLVPYARWVHLAGVRSGGFVTLYVDGVVSGTFSVAAASAGSSAYPVFLGIDAAGTLPTGSSWPGRIAYVALYNTALPAARVLNHAVWAAFVAVADPTLAATDAGSVLSGTAGNQSLFEMGNLPSGQVTVHGVQVLATVRKDDVGFRSVAVLLRSGATTSASAAVAPGVDYRTFAAPAVVDPDTGAAWTSAAVQTLQAGLRVVE